MTDDLNLYFLKADVPANVSAALLEDLGDGDITARLIPADESASAAVITREDATICGVDWVNEVARQVDPTITLDWMVADGDQAKANQVLFQAHGNARSLLTFERCALNFLQCLSGTASIAHYYASLVADTPVRLLDTRKTLPGYRVLQKYAFACGGGYNHRIGLFDRVMLKDNHLAVAGAIGGNRLSETVALAVNTCEDIPIEVEVDRLEQITPVLEAGADIILLDNFSLPELKEAVSMIEGRAWTEASGGITLNNLSALGDLGLDFISTGAPIHQSRWKDIGLDWL